MKITKRNVKCAERLLETREPAVEISEMVYEDAINYIKSAIRSLGAAVKRTPDNSDVAKQAIANLSVILLDLQK